MPSRAVLVEDGLDDRPAAINTQPSDAPKADEGGSIFNHDLTQDRLPLRVVHHCAGKNELVWLSALILTFSPRPSPATPLAEGGEIAGPSLPPNSAGWPYEEHPMADAPLTAYV